MLMSLRYRVLTNTRTHTGGLTWANTYELAQKAEWLGQ
jgi:hypothetical protein